MDALRSPNMLESGASRKRAAAALKAGRRPHGRRRIEAVVFWGPPLLVLFISAAHCRAGEAADQPVAAPGQRVASERWSGGGRAPPGPLCRSTDLATTPAMAPLSSEVLLLSTSDISSIDVPCRLLAASTESLTALKSVCTALPRLLVTPRCARQFRRRRRRQPARLPQKHFACGSAAGTGCWIFS